MRRSGGFDPVEAAKRLRPKMIDLENKKVLLADFGGTARVEDLPKRHLIGDWARKKLYIKPREKNLPGIDREPAAVISRNLNVPFDECNAAFTVQVKGCNLYCWFCYVDDANKDGCAGNGVWVSAEEILTQFLVESRKFQYAQNPDEKINFIRISGGEVSIVPEILFWMIEALENYGLENRVYLWTDTNLTTLDTFWKGLPAGALEKIRSFRNFGLVGCYKGIDPESYHDNTGADPDTWLKQFETHRYLIDLGLDVYSYLAPTIFSECDSAGRDLERRLKNFFLTLQGMVDPAAPLRLYPLEIKNYRPMESRTTSGKETALELHLRVRELWQKMMRERFGEDARKDFHDIPGKTR